MSGNSGAWGIAMWKDGRDLAQVEGISLEGGDPVLPYLPTDPLGCLLVPPDGLGVPPVRSGDVAFAQRDGVVQFGDYYEPRQVTLQVLVQNDACPGCSSADEVAGALVLNGVSPGRAYTPDSPGLEITGDLDIDVHVALDDWTPAANMAVASQFIGATERSYIFQVMTTGPLRLIWNEDGTAATQRSAQSTVAPTVANGADLWVRVKLDVNNGAAGRNIIFETSDDGVTWTQLGTTVTQAGVTSVFDSSADVEIGSHSGGTQDRLIGEVYSARIRSGIDGTVVASPNFDQPAYTGGFYDDQGNLWTIVSPAYLQPFVAAKMSARQKVARLTQEWSRNCPGATLAILSDCHDPAATDEEKVYLGPYLVHGRPRVAEVTWMRSNRGAARVLLRFDAEDARLLLPVENDPDPAAGSWHADHTVLAGVGDAAGGNMHPNYRLEGLTMTTNGGTFTDTHLSAGAPDGGSYFNRNTIASNTSSPMTMDTTPSGTGAIPVTAGTSYTASWWAQKSVVGGPQTRVNMVWYDAGGVLLSSVNGTNMTALTEWSRHSQTFVAPVNAAFLKPALLWSGTALVGQALDFAQIWINEGIAATGPEQIEVVGDLCAFLEVQLSGPMTAPIDVFYGPYQFTYNDDIGALETIFVDLRWGRAANITVDVTQNLSGNYDSPLGPGTWDFSVTTADPADTGTAQAVWQNAVISG